MLLVVFENRYFTYEYIHIYKTVYIHTLYDLMTVICVLLSCVTSCVSV